MAKYNVEVTPCRILEPLHPLSINFDFYAMTFIVLLVNFVLYWLHLMTKYLELLFLGVLQFFASDERIKAVRQMIMAVTTEQRKAALDLLLPYQRSDFEGIFRAMDGISHFSQLALCILFNGYFHIDIARRTRHT